MNQESAATSSLVKIANWSGEKQLIAAEDVEPGVLLVGEHPIAFVTTTPENEEWGPWLLLESVLASQEIFERVDSADLKMTKWPLEPDDRETLGGLAAKYRRNVRKLAQLYHRVASNNIRYSQAEITGYGIWPTLSRSNHSCDPNAQLRATPQQPLAELLIAMRPIARDAAICWNYFSDEAFLHLNWCERNARLLHHFHFLCRCPRCEDERPPRSGNLPPANAPP